MKPVILRILVVIAALTLGTDCKQEATREKRQVTSPGNKTYIVSTIAHPPFMHISNNTNLKGNDRFYGFVPDVLMDLFEFIQARYEIRIVQDGRWGTYDSVGQWNGMIGEVLNRTVDMAAAAITITPDRLRVVDFVRVFADTGITILIKRPDEQSAHLSQGMGVMSIVSYQVWLCLLAAFIVVSVMIWLMEKYSPYGWYKCYQRHEVGQEQGSYFTVANSLWQSLTTLLWQGFDQAPRSISARFLHATWMIFAVLFLVAYTGAVIAQLLISDRTDRWLPHPEINSIEDLAFQQPPYKYEYGCITGGSTHRTLKKLPGPVFNSINKYFHDQGDKVMVKSVEEGIEKVRSSNYALIGEMSTFIDYINKECDLMTVGGLIHKKTHGFALPLDSEISSVLQIAALKLEESGRLRDMEDKWFADEGKCTGANAEFKEKQAALPSTPKFYVYAWGLVESGMVSLGVFWGPLILLLIGAIIAGILLGVEIMYFKHIDKRKYAASQREVLPQHEEGVN